ncbi:MAG: VOC family protein [Acidobacteria bacterium]|nr:VOC family protein [Acidobacteriota bacterium]MBV9483834.1 VOC family protein [Acidobacteriota bacterium]
MEHRISVVLVGVKEMERAIAFYRQVLGLPLKFQTDQYSEFQTEGAVLALEQREQVIATGPAFTFPTANIRRDREGLQKAGVNFWQDLREESYGWVMMIEDSEGNIFEIVEYKP